MGKGLLQLFPLERRDFWRYTADRQQEIREIRLRVDRPVIVLWKSGEVFLDERGYFTNQCGEAYCAQDKELQALFRHICHDSPYAFEEEIRQGFVTVEGGHRVGIAGQVVLETGTCVRTMKHIAYMNIRVAHELKGVADKVLPRLYGANGLKNTLIISPPGCGKTTLLRDLVRRISDGNPYGEGMSVGLVDERSEIAGSYLGHPQNDVGMRTDVLDACPKVLGMMLLLRSMSPKVIAIDEIGGREDMEALRQAAYCGSRILATIHGEGTEDYRNKMMRYGMAADPLFECILVLGKLNGVPVVREICGKEELYDSFAGRNYDTCGVPWNGAVVSGSFHGETKLPARFAADSGTADQ